MKGIGKIDGWKVIKREDDAIIWKNDETKQKTGFWKVGLGDGEIGYEVCWDYHKGLDHGLYHGKNMSKEMIVNKYECKRR